MELVNQHQNQKKIKKNVGSYITSHVLAIISHGSEILFLNRILYEDLQNAVFNAFGEVQYNVKEKVKRVLRQEGFVYTPISTRAERLNKKAFYYALQKKGRRVYRLHQCHLGIWSRGQDKDVLEKVIKTRDKNGNILIQCYARKEQTVRNGSSKFYGMNAIYAYLHVLKDIYASYLKKKQKNLKTMLKIVRAISDKPEVITKLSKTLSTDFIGCLQFIHRKFNSYLYKNRKKHVSCLSEKYKNIITTFLEEEIGNEWMYE